MSDEVKEVKTESLTSTEIHAGIAILAVVVLSVLDVLHIHDSSLVSSLTLVLGYGLKGIGYEKAK